MAEVEKTVTVTTYTLKLSYAEMEVVNAALEQCSDSEIPGSYDLWRHLNTSM